MNRDKICYTWLNNRELFVISVFLRSIRAGKVILPACFALILYAAPARAQQTFVAVNDTVKTEPLRTVKADVIKNDTIPCDNYTWRIILLQPSQGTTSKEGDNIVFTPKVDCRDDTVRITYGVTCGMVEQTATLVVIVSNLCLPVNVIDPYTSCVNDMPFNINFEPALKYIATPTVGSINIPTDGFSMSLVGDINGDGRPEIVALGLGRTHGNTDGAGWAGRAWYIHIYNGQNGKRLWSVNLGTEPSNGGISNVTSLGHSGITSNINETNDQFQLRYVPRHNSPGHIAIADMDRDGVAEIVVVETGNIGLIYALTPTIDPVTREIKDFSEKWTGNVNGTVRSYKDPYTATTKDNNHERFGTGVPYITDLNHDGRPEVIVYNKIYDGIDGNLVCTLEKLQDFGYTTSAGVNATNFDEYAFVGRRPGAADAESYIPCFSIADIDGDGIIDIVAGSKVYLMKDSVSNGRHIPACKAIIRGPSQVTAQRGTGSGNFTCQVNDGFTSVVDIDLDGNLDVIVFAAAKSALNKETQSVIYVWDPMNNPSQPKAVTYLYTNSGSGTFSYPFIGDINGRLDSYDLTKKLPEICMVTGRLWTNGGDNSNATDTKTGSKLAVHPLSNGLSLSNSSFNANRSSSIEGHVLAFTYHAKPDGSTPLHQRLKLSWAMEHKDESSSTGITMFDFDNDGIKELVYRDELTLRIISPAGSSSRDLVTNSYVSSTGTDKSIIRLNQPGVRSYTGFEAPVIADVDLDGSADIVTTGTDATFSTSHTSRDERSRGYIYVFEHKGGSDKWAPCPPVWNQTVYFPLQINENLTIPPYPQSRLTQYRNINGEIVYPYNGHWVQHPIVREGQTFTPIVRNPNAMVTNMNVQVGVPTSNDTRVTLTVKNTGSASLNANTPVSFYHGGIKGSGGYEINDQRTQFIMKFDLGEDIFPNNIATLTYDIPQNLNDILVWARIVDDNRTFPATGYTDCDTSNNAASGADCPWLVYSVSASDTILCGSADEAILTAVPINTPISPSYQWYRNDGKITGATADTYVARQTGTYKCFVIEDICSGFSSEKVIGRVEPKANHDYVVSVNGATVRIPILDNDLVLGCVPVIPLLTKLPSHGQADIVNDTLVYTPVPGYFGGDTLQYGLPSVANVYITMHYVTDARNDTISVLTATPEEVNVLANDIVLSGCTPSVSVSIVPKHGGAYVSSNKIVYTSDNHYSGLDSLTYRLTCGNEVSFAKIIIKVSPPRVVYVKQNATGTGDGSSWTNAYGNLADPLLWAAEQRQGIATGLGTITLPVDTIREIWVAAGTYYPLHMADTLSAVRSSDERFKAFVLVDGVKVYGGFPAHANDTDHDLVLSRHYAVTAVIEPTILSGDIGLPGYEDDNAYHVIVAANIPDNKETVLDGFIITDSRSTNLSGGPIVNGTQIDVSGAISCFNASPVLANLKITGNSGHYGGGICTNSSSPQIFNVLVSGNSSGNGIGGLSFTSSSPILTNVTVSGNYGIFGGIRLTGASVLTLNNSIIWGNHSDYANSGGASHDHSISVAGGTADISHSLVQYCGGSGGSWNTNIGNDFGGNIDADPYFIGAIPAASTPSNGGDYRVDYNSPARNTGKNELFPHGLQNISLLRNAYDINGDFRLIDNLIDIGAYEHQTWTVPPTPRVFYVKEGGSGYRTGDTWQDAYPNLADPVLWAYQQRESTLPVVYPGDTITQIWVAAGTYRPMYIAGTGSSDRDKAFVLSDDLKIYGGFPQSSDDIRHTSLDSRFVGGCKGTPCLAPTILSGDLDGNDISNNIKTDNVHHVVIASDISDNGKTVLDGFTISGGYADGVGDIFITANSIATNSIERNKGGAVYNVAASPVYANLRIVENYANKSGGGVYCDSTSSAPSFIASTISANKAKRDGGALTLGDGGVRFVNSVITGNHADSIGGAMNILAGNHLLLNSTVAGNRADSLGGGIYTGGSIDLQVINSIIWGNRTYYGIDNNIYRDTLVNNNVYLHHKFSVVGDSKTGYNMGAWDTYFGVDGGGNLDLDPQFEDYINPMQNGWQPTSSGDYRLQYGSAALGKADDVSYMNSFVPPLTGMQNEVDLDGNPRIFGVMDIGAYENQTIPPPTFPIMYVKKTGTGSGSSWNDAYPNLADPLLWADRQRKGTFGPVAAGDTIREIWVAAGTYKPMHKAALHKDTLSNPTTDRDKAFVLVDGVKIYGGFPASANNIDNSALESRFPVGCTSRECLAPTILSGDIAGNDLPGNMTANKSDNVYHVVVSADVDTGTVLDGFIIEGGNADDNADNFIIVGIIVVPCDKGGGIYCTSSSTNTSPLFENLVLRGNSTRKYGGGIYISAGSPTISRSLISGNFAVGAAGQGIGGGMYISGALPKIVGVIIGANTAGVQGGGVTIFNCNPLFTDVRISGNQAPMGAGGSMSYSEPVFTNVTISGNRAQNESGGIYMRNYSNPTFNNSIIWGNAAPIAPEVHFMVGASASFRSSLVGGSGGSANWSMASGTDLGGNVDADPLFTARINPSQGGWQPTDGGDYTLKHCSPAIGAGINTAYPYAFTTDLGGNARISGGIIDMGAYEKPLVTGLTNGIFYVKQTCRGTGDGSSWTNAYGNLADPLFWAEHQSKGTFGPVASGDTIRQIRVAGGTYVPRHKVADNDEDGNPTTDRDKAFVLVKGVKIYGGFPNNANDTQHTTLESRGSVMAHFSTTTLSGDIEYDDSPGNFGQYKTDNAYHVVVGSNIPAGGETVLDGFVVTGGHANGNNHKVTVNGEQFPRTGGGGIVNFNASPLFTNLIVEGNFAESKGGGMYTVLSSPQVDKITFRENRSNGDGGGAFLADNSRPEFTNVNISGNSAANLGGGIAINAGRPVFIDALVNGNFATTGGGIAINNTGNIDFTNITVGGNRAQNTGGGISLNSSSPTFNNSIVWGNAAGSAASDNLLLTGANPEYVRSLVQGSGSGGVWNATLGIDGGNNIDTDPMFENPITSGQPSTAGDYRLRNGSPAINKGDSLLYKQAVATSFLYNGQSLQNIKDLDGMRRVLDGNIDIGAYEKALSIKPYNGVFYVKRNFCGNADGSSWADAYGNLADPLLWAVQQRNGSLGNVDPNDTIREIWVAEGVYKPMYYADGNGTDNRDKAFVLVHGVKIYGGFPDNADNSTHITLDSRYAGNCAGNACLATTTLSGDLKGDDTPYDFNQNRTDNAYHVVVAAGIPDDGQTVLDGFTLSGGSANHPVTQSFITVNGETIARRMGGAIYNVNAGPVYSNLLVTDNYAVDAGGFYSRCDIPTSQVPGTSPLFTGVTFTGNMAEMQGGAGRLAQDSTRFVNCVMTGNYAAGATAYGGAMLMDDTYMRIMNSTIAGNYATTDGGGLGFYGTGDPRITNSIIYGNASSSVGGKNIFGGNNAGVQFRFCHIEGCFIQPGTWDLSLGADSLNNSDRDPYFDTPVPATPAANSSGNYRLRPGSSAINSADSTLYMESFSPHLTSMRDEKDADGLPRLVGTKMDRGAYEAPPVMPPTFSVMYVKGPLGDGNKDGSSWEHAYPNLADPLYWADMQRKGTATVVSPYDTIREIWVAEGTYVPLYKAADRDNYNNVTNNRHRAFLLVDGVKIYGGFPTVADDTNHDAVSKRPSPLAPTILSGALGGNDSVHHVIVASDLKPWKGESALLDGFTVKGGNANDTGASYLTVNGNHVYNNMGGGMLAINSAVDMKSVSFTENISHESGGGIHVTGGQLSLSDCSITENNASFSGGSGGGGIYADNSTLILDRVSVNRNSSSTALGGGIYTYNGSLRAIRTEITGNLSSGGGGLFLEGTATDLINVLIAGNAAGTSGGGVGGGLFSSGSNVRMTNVTVAGNASSFGSAVYGNPSSSVIVDNGIVWGNNVPVFSPTGTFTFRNSLVEGCGGSNAWTGIAGADGGNNIDDNPLFSAWINPSGQNWQPTSTGDYHLQPGSPVTNKGNNLLYMSAFNPPLQDMQGQVDLDGMPRVLGSSIDMGTYEISTLLYAVNDAATTDSRTSATIDVLDNDLLIACNRNNLTAFDILTPVSSQNGTLTVNADKTITYTPANNFTGLDYFDYYVKCNADSSAARVNIIVFKPLAWKYIACTNAEVTLGVNKVAGVNLLWYDAQGAVVARDTSKIEVVKNGNSVQNFWVEASHGGITFPRYKVELALSDDCGNAPSICATNGTLLFLEDFGGNQPADFDYSNVGLPQGTTEYQFVAGIPTVENRYCLTKEFAGDASWYPYDDHTYPGDVSRGYMMTVNADDEPKLLYTTTVDGLCPGMNLNFSTWVGNLARANTTPSVHPNLRFLLEDPGMNDVLAEYVTGEIPPEQTAEWKLYGFAYTSTSASVRLSIYNAASGSGDNDLVLDDVEVRLCAPPINVTRPANDLVEICEGTLFTMDGLYVDNSTFGMDLTMRLERNITDRLYDPAAWTPVNGTELTSDNGSIDTVYSFVVSPSDTGYYRVVASSPALVDRYSCRAMSRIVRLNVTRMHIPPDIRIYVKPEPGLIVNLSSYIDSLHRAYDIKWTVGVSPALLGGTETTTGTIDFSTWGGYFSTYIYTYEMTDAVCGTKQAKAYLRIVKSYNDTLTVRVCKDLPQTDRLNLNQILGLESESGQWTWLTNTNNVLSDNVTVVPAGRRHEGAYLFDAVAAFAQAGSDYYYKNNPNEKKFEFEYSNHTGTMKKKVKLIVY